MAATTKTHQKKATTASEKPLNSWIKNEISRLAAIHGIDPVVLHEFAEFVVKEHKKKDPKPPKPLTITQLKAEIYKHFKVKDTKALKLSGEFQVATSGIDTLDLSKKDGWEILYRKLIGILPNEKNEQGYGCVNGINIFKYDLPWKIFALDPGVANTAEVKSAYHALSKIYHPDNPETGDAKVFDRLTIFYKSLTEKF
jgi:hypothetical protein